MAAAWLAGERIASNVRNRAKTTVIAAVVRLRKTPPL